MIPRLEADAWPAKVRETLAPRIQRLGYVGEFFKCAAHQPDALVSFMAFTEDLKRALPERLTEVVALTVSTLLRNDYERHQHERLCLKLGFNEQWIRTVESLEPASSAGLESLSTPERAVQTLTLAVVERHGENTTRELNALVETIGHEQAVGVLMQIGRYVTHALMVNALELKPPVESPLSG